MVGADLVEEMLRTDLDALMRRHLREDEARVLQYRFGLLDNKPRTIPQVAEKMQLPYASAKHLLFSALTKMRRPHVAHALRDYYLDEAR